MGCGLYICWDGHWSDFIQARYPQWRIKEDFQVNFTFRNIGCVCYISLFGTTAWQYNHIDNYFYNTKCVRYPDWRNVAWSNSVVYWPSHLPQIWASGTEFSRISFFQCPLNLTALGSCKFLWCLCYCAGPSRQILRSWTRWPWSSLCKFHLPLHCSLNLTWITVLIPKFCSALELYNFDVDYGGLAKRNHQLFKHPVYVIAYECACMCT